MPYDKLLEQRRIKPYRSKPQEVEHSTNSSPTAEPVTNRGLHPGT